MHVLLLVLGILKIILILLVIVLLALLLLLALILFVPFCYDIEAGYADEVNMVGKFSWLFNMLQLHYYYGKAYEKPGGQMILKVLFFTFHARRQKQRQAEHKGEEKIEEKIEGKIDPVAYEEDPAPYEPDKDADKGNERHTKQKKTLKARLLSFTRQTKDQYDQAMAAVRYPQLREITDLTFRLIKKLWRAVKPRRFHIDGQLGLSDPYATGLMFGGIGMLMAFTKWDIRLKADFERYIVDIKARAVGGVMLFAVFWPLLLYIFKAPIWHIIRKNFLRKGVIE